MLCENKSVNKYQSCTLFIRKTCLYPREEMYDQKIPQNSLRLCRNFNTAT